MSLDQFHEVSFPIPLALASSGGPERRVEVVPLSGGGEVRNAVWARSRRRWDVGSAVTKLEALQALVAFFEARGGKLHGFRFRDVLDDRSSVAGATVTATDQAVAVGDGETRVFGLVKTYGDYRRRIVKPVAGSVLVAVEGVPVNVAGVNTETGEIVFDTAPVSGAVITAGYRFDCAVRFDVDRLDVNLEAFGAGRVVSAPLIELVG